MFRRACGAFMLAVGGFVAAYALVAAGVSLVHPGVQAGALSAAVHLGLFGLPAVALVGEGWRQWRRGRRPLDKPLLAWRGRRWLWGTVGVVYAGVALLFARPAYHVIRTALEDITDTGALPPGFVDDASRMNATRVAEVVDIPADPGAAEEQLRELLRRARAEGLRVAIAGTRHTMGGHTIYPGGLALNMLPFRHLELDEKAGLLHAGSGARWSEIIPYLDARGFSVGVMQSNNSFSVGGSISANCHGWQPNQPPIASTVAAFRLMKADGAVVRCSRNENAELFGLGLGGYGLFGVILDVDLRVVRNERYSLDRQTLASDRYVAAFREQVDRAPNAGMAFGRLCVVPGEDTFLRPVVLNVFRRRPCRPEEIPPLSAEGLVGFKRAVFRGSVGSDYGKRLRWEAELKMGGEQLTGRFFSRNQLLNEGADLYQEHSAGRTDILHEYFIPPEHFEDSLVRLREIIPRHGGDLLNVTVRNVLRDPDTVLRYAARDVFSFVMLFNQGRTPTDDARMEAMTRQMIDAALDAGGSYYLPYRLHATREQFVRAYPRAEEFFALKRKYDPDEVFQNQFYRRYGRPE